MSRYDSFNAAFDGQGGSCVADCACGRTFYDAEEGHWSWEEGERKRLEESDAIAVDGGPYFIMFEGQIFVGQCDCWHPRREVLCGFIDGHARQIAEYLTLEKSRKQREADAAPVVEA